MSQVPPQFDLSFLPEGIAVINDPKSGPAPKKPSIQKYNWMMYSTEVVSIIKTFYEIIASNAEEKFIKEALIYVIGSDNMGITFRLSKKRTLNSLRRIIPENISLQWIDEELDIVLHRVELFRNGVTFCRHIKNNVDNSFFYQDFLKVLNEMQGKNIFKFV